MTKKKFNLTPSLRRHAPLLVLYEIKMFLTSLQAWKVDLTILHPCLSELFNNARIETTLVHARILLDFFECPPTARQDDDILSADMGFSAKPIPRSKSLRISINKRSAHLTYHRAEFVNDRQKKQWSSGVFQPLVQRCSDFLNADLPNDFVAQHMPSQFQTTWNDLKAQVTTM